MRALPPPPQPLPQHLADMAMDSLLRASPDAADVGWGYELHYLAHHPVHVALLAVAVGGVSMMIQRGREKIKTLKAEFLSQGVDLTNVDNRVDTLVYLKVSQPVVSRVSSSSHVCGGRRGAGCRRRWRLGRLAV